MRVGRYTRQVLVMMVLLSTSAAAQSQEDPPRVAVAAGAGLAIPFHGDFDFTPWAWDADVRLGMSRLTALEVAVGEWRHTDRYVAQNIVVRPPAHTIGRLERDTTRSMRIGQVNLLLRAASGRTTFTGGGGVGLLWHERRTRAVTEACPPGIACGASDSDFSSASGTAQGVGGVEVRIAHGFSAHVQSRFIVNIRDVGGSELRLTAGMRWGFGGWPAAARRVPPTRRHHQPGDPTDAMPLIR